MQIKTGWRIIYIWVNYLNIGYGLLNITLHAHIEGSINVGNIRLPEKLMV